MPGLHTILVADDEPDLRDTIAAILADAGYAVLTASDGYDAVGVLADNSVNLLITDIRMPGMNGFERARQAKVMRPPMHVIYLTGFAADSARNAGPIYGPVLQKPMRMDELLDEVSRQLA
jgi:DNA-binding response OmpR family regulator